MTEPRPAPAPPEVETEVAGEFDELEVDAPRVGIVMGSKSDMEAMEKASRELDERGISHETRVMSAHRDPDVVADYARNARMRGGPGSASHGAWLACVAIIGARCRRERRPNAICSSVRVRCLLTAAIGRRPRGIIRL